jgi:uncharacterized protein
LLRTAYERLVARPAAVVLLALLTCVPMGHWSAKLFGALRADVRDLLPESARSVVVLRDLEKKFGGFSQLSILIESPDSAANRRFSDDLVAKVSKHEMVRSVRNKLGDEKTFFEHRRHLFVELDDLETILERIEDAANDARARANPLLVDLENAEPVKLDFSDLEKKYARKLSLAKRFSDGYFENEDKTQLAILLRKQGMAFGIEANRRLVGDVHAAIADLDPAKYHPNMVVSTGGDVKNLIEEHESLIEDLVLATAIVFVLLAFVVVAYYQRLRALYLLAVPVLIGCAWTFGLSWFLVGNLNASSAFLIPIIPGNGMNFGLILLARYVEERRRGESVRESTEKAVRYTIKATSMVSLVTAVAYGSLIATDFLGFKHFGIIGGLGMLLCWAATFVVMPALIIWVETWSPSKDLKLIKPGILASLPGALVSRAPKAFAWGGIAIAAACAALTALYFEDPLEKDFNQLRSRHSINSGSAKTAAKVDAIFGIYQEPQVIVAEHEEDVPAIVARLETIIREGGEKGPLADVTALSTLVPPDQEAKLEVLRKIRAVLSDDLLANLDEKERALVEEHRPPADLAVFSVKDLPETVRADFRELDGREGRVVLALPNMKLNLYHADEIERVSSVLRNIQLADGRQVESSGNFVIYSDMIAAVRRDGPRATAYSLAGVLLVCFLAYRRLRRVAIVTGSVVVGVAALGASMWLFGLKINFLNFIALPITFGIGVDYAINVYTRYLIERQTSDAVAAAKAAIASTGGAVTLCSLTTIIGYASLLVASNGALISFGQVAILGEIVCLAAAVFVLPGWLMYWKDR